MSKRRGGRNAKFFDSLKPLGDALGGVIHDHRVLPRDRHGNLIDTRKSMDSPSLEDRLAQREAKLQRRAAAAKRASSRP